MSTRVAIFLLRIHILDKASQLPLRDRLKYLRFCRLVHLLCIFVFAILAVGCSFCALAVFFPQLLTMLGIPLPTDQGKDPFLMSGIFVSIAVFSGICCSALFVTREILALCWLLNFSWGYGIHKVVPYTTAAQ